MFTVLGSVSHPVFSPVCAGNFAPDGIGLSIFRRPQCLNRNRKRLTTK